jgi:hypothetical protein
MANNESDDRELNSYLNGNSELSNGYRSSNKQEPASHLDEAILSAAKEAVNVSNNIKQKTKAEFHKAPWVKPLSIAAMITLSVSLVVTMQQESGQPLINEFDVEILDSASIIKESAISETKLNSEDVSVTNEIESRQNKVERPGVPAPASLSATADTYRAEEKTEAPKVRIKVTPAKKMLSKGKPQFEAIEDRVFSEEQNSPSISGGVAFDDTIKLKQDRELSMQEDALLKIKALWEKGEFVKAKKTYEEFTKDYPDVSSESMKEILGYTIYNGLFED